MEHLLDRSGRYYFRIRIPADLHHIFQKKEIKYSLKTSHIKTVKAFVKILTIEIKNTFTQLRERDLTRQEIQKIVRKLELSLLEVFDKARVLPGLSDTHLMDSKTTSYAVMGIKLKLAENDDKEIMPTADAIIKRLKLPIESGSLEYNVLCQELLKSMLAIFGREEKRFKGEFNDEPITHAGTTALQPQGKLLSDVIQEYLQKQAANNAWKPKDAAEHKDFYSC